jgi:excisionase family DNA binding protein
MDINIANDFENHVGRNKRNMPNKKQNTTHSPDIGVKEACEILNVKKSELERLIKTNKVPFIKNRVGHRRFDRRLLQTLYTRENEFFELDADVMKGILQVVSIPKKKNKCSSGADKDLKMLYLRLVCRNFNQAVLEFSQEQLGIEGLEHETILRYMRYNEIEYKYRDWAYEFMIPVFIAKHISYTDRDARRGVIEMLRVHTTCADAKAARREIINRHKKRYTRTGYTYYRSPEEMWLQYCRQRGFLQKVVKKGIDEWFEERLYAMYCSVNP